MATTALPRVIDALIVAAEACAPDGVLVLDGFGLTDDPGDFIMIGVEDPDLEDYAQAGTSQQEWAHAVGDVRDERGSVTCCVVAWNGDSDPRAARNRVYEITGALEEYVRQNYTLGLAEIVDVEFGLTHQLSQGLTDKGAEAMAVFGIAFHARV